MTKSAQYFGAMFLYGMIAGYLFVGLGILAKGICSWTGLDSVARRLKRPFRSTATGYDRRFGKGWMPRNTS